MPETKTEIGQYRPAHRIREGWQIRFLSDSEDLPDVWLTVTRALRIYSPINMVSFTFDDDSDQGARHDTDVFCRNLAEIRRAEAS